MKTATPMIATISRTANTMMTMSLKRKSSSYGGTGGHISIERGGETT